MTGLRLAARRWHTSIRKNLLRERRTRCTAKWACHSLVESNDPVGNLTRPLLLVSNAPFNFYAFHRSLLIKTPAFAIVSSNLSFTREKGRERFKIYLLSLPKFRTDWKSFERSGKESNSSSEKSASKGETNRVTNYSGIFQLHRS